MNAGGRAEGRVCEICAMPWRVLNACKNPFLFKESVGSLWPRTESSSDHTLFFSAPNHLPAKCDAVHGVTIPRRKIRGNFNPEIVRNAEKLSSFGFHHRPYQSLVVAS